MNSEPLIMAKRIDPRPTPADIFHDSSYNRMALTSSTTIPKGMVVQFFASFHEISVMDFPSKRLRSRL